MRQAPQREGARATQGCPEILRTSLLSGCAGQLTSEESLALRIEFPTRERALTVSTAVWPIGPLGPHCEWLNQHHGVWALAVV